MHILVTVFFTLLSIFICSEKILAQSPRLELRPIIQDRLTGPLFVTNAHDGSGRLFILEQRGRILVVPQGSSSSGLFLDLTEKVLTSTERGLLGLAFHPDFSENQRFFVYYIRKPDGMIVVAEYRISASNPNVADPSESVVLTIPHPDPEHNGGTLAFGPDGFLYISTGDGGGSYDPSNNAQSLNSLLGKILRIDIDHPTSAAVRYSSPSSNPFFGEKIGRDEIYAYGLRNPWRFSFDPVTDEIYVGDVGQDALEEVNVIEAGGNYGWRVFEGSLCTNRGPAQCDESNYVGPVAQYGHTGRGGRCSITGGYVYRGNQQTFPFGAYIYGDYCTGEIFMLYRGEEVLLVDTSKQITSFGLDEDGEIYVVGGTVDRIVNTSAAAPTTRFELPDGGSVTFETLGTAEEISVEHAQIQPNDDESRPAALAFIEHRKDGVLVSEAAVPATSLIESGRFYAEVGNSADTGVAITNPDGARSVLVALSFTDVDGNDAGGSSVRIPPGGQIAGFLDEPSFEGPSVFRGSVTFTSPIPVSVVALRGITNEKAEFLTSTLPVVDLASVQTEPILVPQFAAGGGWTTDLILINPSDELINGKVQLRSPAGQAQEAKIDGLVGNTVLYAIPARSSRKLRVTNDGAVRVGSALVTANADQATPSAAAIYTYAAGEGIVSTTGALAGATDTAFDIYCVMSGQPGVIGSIQTGVAIANPSAAEIAVNFELLGLDGEPSGVAGTLQIPPNGQMQSFVHQFPGAEDLPRPFQGTLRTWSAAPVAAVAIRGRYNERGQFLLTTTPPANSTQEEEVFIPAVVDGGGYSTQIVIFGGTENPPASGNIYFFQQNGEPVTPTMR